MKVWKHSRVDAVLLALSILHFIATLIVASRWEVSSHLGRATAFAVLLVMTVYNIIVVSHLFTHTHWFESPVLNSLVSMLNSINIGQSVQAYHLTHVRNHHRYSNDQPDSDGRTRDTSSTFRDGVRGDHATLFRYAFVGAAQTLFSVGRDLLSIARLGRVSEREAGLWETLSKEPAKRATELRQLRLDRAAHLLGLCLFAVISWKWTLFCYLPMFYLSLAFVNVQNYYEHYGAAPGNTYANSVSYYGKLYNLLTFNDGYHQEHHLRAQAHWRSMPSIREAHGAKLDAVERIICPVPAIVGFLHRNRRQLHRVSAPRLEGPGGSEQALPVADDLFKG